MGADLDLLCYATRINSDRADIGYYDEEPIVPRFLQFASDRRLVTRNRYRLYIFVCLECKEVYKTRREVLALRYRAYPPGWQYYEVPYGSRAANPPLLYYASSRLLRDIEDS